MPHTSQNKKNLLNKKIFDKIKKQRSIPNNINKYEKI